MEFDAIDQQLVGLLREDGRMSNRELAARLSLTEASVRSRIRRLTRENLMRVVAVADFAAMGFDLMLSIGVGVEGRLVQQVAEELARFPQVLACNLIAGRYDIEIFVAVESHDRLRRFVLDELAGVAGIREVESALALDILKYQVDWTPFTS